MRATDRRKSRFHVEAQSLFGPDVFGKAIGAILLASKAVKGSKIFAAQWQLKKHIDKGGSFDINLGLREIIYDRPGINFTNFVQKGFTSHRIQASGPMRDWFPGVAQSINTIIAHGGRIKFHLDGLDLNALYNFKNVNFDKRTITELQWLIGKDLLKHVDFMIDNAPASKELMGKLDDAIKLFRESDTFKKTFGSN